MDVAVALLGRIYCGFLPVAGVLTILSVPQRLGFPVVAEEAGGVILGAATAAVFLRYPYGRKAGLAEIVLGGIAFLAWLWMAMHYEAWIVGMADRTIEKWGPAIVAVVLSLEALRKSCGLAIALLAWVFIAYGLFGHHAPGVLQAFEQAPTKLILFLYADSNAITGIVLRVIIFLVLAFIIMGKLMEVSGATAFFTDLAMGLMGHRRGGPAKVSVVASACFGTISGSTVANIMAEGLVTIPLMKRSGFKPHVAAAIEAAASNGGQIMPPVMGTTAFLIAEFLQMTYAEVAIAAAIPALLYYFTLFVQVDAVAARFGLVGLPRSELPRPLAVLARDWIFIGPFAVLIYLIFGLGYNPGLSALYSTGVLLFLMIVRNRRIPTRAQWSAIVFGSGETMLPLILIGAGAGVVIGVLNSSGLGFQLALVLTHLGENAGLFVMLLLTAFLSIVLGMGMPTAAVYVVLSIVLAPAIVKMGVEPLAAHLFLFYFGLLSMLTPPVAVGSYVAAGLAGSDMWRTGLVGVQLAAIAYLLPFLWIYSPGLILNGSPAAIVYAIVTATVGCWMLARCILAFDRNAVALALTALLLVGSVVVGSATIWIGPETPLCLIPAALGSLVVFATRRPAVFAGRPSPAE